MSNPDSHCLPHKTSFAALWHVAFRTHASKRLGQVAGWSNVLRPAKLLDACILKELLVDHSVLGQPAP